MTRLGTPRPNNGGSRSGAGALRKRVQLKPFAAPKGETTSLCCIDFERCNHCGAVGWGEYVENVWGMDGEWPVLVAEIEHAAQPLQHKPGCPVGG